MTTTTTDKPVRVLPADVYDTLEFSALVYGGIGRGSYSDDYDGVWAPRCALGHAVHAVGPFGFATSLTAVLRGVQIDETSNDAVVIDINARRGRPGNARVTFAEWCQELNVIRGD